MRPRVLIAFTVYNGREFVPRALDSLTRLQRDVADIDVLVLDDASPEPGWSEELAALCAAHGFLYYCTPRNLGIPRNVNLGLLAAVEGGYDHVVISNSDVIYSAQAISQLVRAAETDPQIGAVTSWSTNVSVYSLPNRDPDAHLADPAHTDWLATVLAEQFAENVLDIPAGISFAMLVPTRMVKEIGLMDPVFGRGYCEETDWSQRCLAAGYRLVLANGAFVYHMGGGSNVAAGVLTAGHTSVPKNERIISMRYPDFVPRVGRFIESRVLEGVWAQAAAAIMRQGAMEFGYSLTVGWLPPTLDDTRPAVVLSPDSDISQATVTFLGFEHRFPVKAESLAADLVGALGAAPAELNLFDRGPIADAMATAFGDVAVVHRRQPYPSRV